MSEHSIDGITAADLWLGSCPYYVAGDLRREPATTGIALAATLVFRSGRRLRVWITNRPEPAFCPGGNDRIQIDGWTLTIERAISSADHAMNRYILEHARELLDVVEADDENLESGSNL